VKSARGAVLATPWRTACRGSTLSSPGHQQCVAEKTHPCMGTVERLLRLVFGQGREGSGKLANEDVVEVGPPTVGAAHDTAEVHVEVQLVAMVTN